MRRNVKWVSSCRVSKNRVHRVSIIGGNELKRIRVDADSCSDHEEGIIGVNVTMDNQEEEASVHPTFKFGDSYRTFEELQKKLTEFEEFHYCKFWKREARTIEAAKKRVARYLNPALKYYQLKYTCIHGGQVFRPKGKGNRSTS